MPEEYTSTGVISGLAAKEIAGCRILLPRADIAPRELADGVARLGAVPHEVTAYVTKLPADSVSLGKQMLLDGQIDIITFTSSSTVTNLLTALGDEWYVAKNATIACIGPVTATTAEKAGLRVDIIAWEQTISGLVAAIEDACS